MPPASTEISYDEVPYDGGMMDAIHPNTFAVMGTLFGLTPPRVETCSVLEIGCASGGNLVPMAYGLPRATFVGIDPAGTQLRVAEQRARELGITNVRLVEAGIEDFAAGSERFDYIICHGVFSWVEDSVREAILDSCRRLLTPQGVAYISYNTLPGFYARAPIRDAMRFHASHFPETDDRIGQARAFMQFLREATHDFRASPSVLGAYGTMVEHEVLLLSGAEDNYIAHEHLSDENTAFYFHEFAAMLPPHQLQYLGDTQFHTMVPWNLPQPIAAEIDRLASTQVLAEQYRDFVVDRGFRRSLLCRSDLSLQRNIDSGAVAGFRFRILQPRDPSGDWVLTRPGNQVLPVTDPGLRAVLDDLEASAPGVPTFKELLDEVAPVSALDEERLAGALLTLFGYGAIEVRLDSPAVATRVDAIPEVYLPARLAATERARGWIPTPFHTNVQFAGIAGLVLPEVDGSKDLPALAQAMRRHVEAGLITSETPLTDADLHRFVEDSLEQFRFHGLLVPSGADHRP